MQMYSRAIPMRHSSSKATTFLGGGFGIATRYDLASKEKFTAKTGNYYYQVQETSNSCVCFW